MANPTVSNGHGSLATGAITALALAVQTGLAAVVGVIIAREFGRDAETDGFFAAYGVFIVLALAATAIRVTVLPRFARARAAGRLSAEVVATGKVVAAVALPLVVICVIGRDPLGGLLTGLESEEARTAAAAALPWMALAGAGQLAAGLLASAFAALDDYRVPALGFITGSAAGLLLILVRVEADGIVAVAWGVALNAAISALVPAVVLARRARQERMPRSAIADPGDSTRARLAELGAGTAVPLTLQAIFLVCLPMAAAIGVGAVTSLGYAYMIGSAVVSVTAASLGLVTSVPLTRQGFDAERVAHHVEASSWIALVAIGATGGLFAVAGEGILAPVLGGGYSAEVGAELGRVVVAFVPWMVVSVAITVVFPLVFVHGRTGRLPLIALAALALHLPLALVGQRAFGLAGLTTAMAISTAIALLALLRVLGAATRTLRRLVPAVLLVAATTLAAFVPASVLGDGVAAGAIGCALYAATLVALRPRGLRASWHYLRSLG